MSLNSEILELAETLEAIRFLTNTPGGDAPVTLQRTRETLATLNRASRLRFRASLCADLKEIRKCYGALASNSQFREVLTRAKQSPGYTYLFKHFIENVLFRRYERVFPRWPFMPSHALVVLDGQTQKPKHSVYLPEAEFFADALHMLEQAKLFHKGIDDFRERSAQNQKLLQTHLRAAATATFQALEAYLNGLAYDCFMAHHDSLPLKEHDLLAEWNSDTKRRRFTPFEKKLRNYPPIAAKAVGRQIDLSGWACVSLIVDVGKRLRDAVTHPSPFIDPGTKEHEKMVWIAGINLDIVEQLIQAARDYMVAVQEGLPTGTVDQSAPWLLKQAPH